MTLISSKAPRLRREVSPSYRLEWRRLMKGVGGDVCDLRFETARDAAAIRAFGLSVAGRALGGEFRVTAPDGRSAHVSLDGLRRWSPDPGSLPPEHLESLWLAEHGLVSEVDGLMTAVRRELLLGVERRLLSMRQALLLLAALRSVTRRVVG